MFLHIAKIYIPFDPESSAIARWRSVMRSLIRKRTVLIDGRKTSVGLEDAFWNALTEIAISLEMTPSQLVTSIDMRRDQSNLSSCLRIFVLNFYVDKLASQRSAPLRKVASSEAGVATANEAAKSA